MAQPWEVDWSKQGAGKADDDSTPPWERKWGAAPAKKPEAAKTRNPAAFLNDTVIEAGNAVAGAVKSVGDFLAPGNRVSEFIDTNIIKAGEANQSDAVKAEKAKYRAEMEGAEGIGDEIGATLGYVGRNPIQSLAQAAGSFAVPGAAVKAGGMLGSVAGLGVQGATRTGLAGGAVAGAALSGGDAAGTAYELVKRAGGSDKEATEAARRASVLPAAIGAAGGVIGAERLLAGAGGFKGGALSRALTTAGVEGAQEAVEEGVTQYEGRRAAVPFDPSIDPLKGVAGAATMGAVLGGATGAGVSLLHGKPAEQKKDAGDILAAPTVDAAISNAMLAIAGPVAKPAWEVVDGLALPGPAQPEAPTMLRSLPAPDGQPVYMADERGNVAPQPAEARAEALNRQFEAGQQAEAAARATDALGITPGLRRAQQQRELRDAEGNLIPVGEATELPNIPTGDATELEPIPAGEAAELVPTPDATELEPIPAGEATELEVQTIEPGDLMAKDGEPFVSKTGAQARAFSAGGRVVSIPDHFGSGKPGYVVRPITEVRPNNTRGTDARDLPKGRNDNQPDVSGTAGQPAANGAGRPVADVGGKLAAGRVAADATGEQPGAAAGAVPSGSADAPVGTGSQPNAALTPGQRVTLPNKDGVREVWTVDGQTGNILRLDNGKGRMRAVQVGSPTWDAIQPEGGAATDQATNQNGVSETAGGKPLAGTLQPTPQADAKPAPEPARTQALAPAAAAATEPAAAAARPAGLEADGLTTEPSGGPELEAAGFKNTPSMPNGWGRTVMDGPNVKHLFGVREFGTPKKYRVTRSTSFPGTSMTGAPTLELGTFSTPGQALAAVQSDLEKRMPGRAPAVATPNAEASAQAATRGAEAAPAAPAPSDVSTSAANLNTSPERVQKAPESEQVARNPKAQAVKEALAKAEAHNGDAASTPNRTPNAKDTGGPSAEAAPAKPLDALAAKLDGPEMSARPTFTSGRRVVRVVSLKQANSALSIVADGDGFKVVQDNDMAGGLREKIAARLAEMSAGNVAADIAPTATHKDPGEPAEAVTPAVVRDAIKTGVQATDRKPSAMKAELLAKIDEAVKDAPDYMDFQAAVKTMGLKDATAVFTDAKGTLGEKSAPDGYSRPKRMFRIEGDGVFSVNNTVRQLLTFRAKVESSPGFRDRQAPAGLTERATDTLDRRSSDAAIAGMIDEGDFQAALDYAAAKSVDMEAVRLTKVLRDRLNKWEKDQASAKALAEYQAAQAEGKPAPGSLAAAFAEKEAEAKPAPAAEPEADDTPEAGIASQTFDQWVRAKYNGNEYKAKYLEEFGGDEKRAILGAAAGTIDNDQTTSVLLKTAKQEYRSELFKLPRETSISLDVWDALDNMAKVEAQRHFYDLDRRITRRTQDETKARVEAERIKKAPYEAVFAEVDAEIRRLDALPGPETQKQKDLSARRDRLREALYQIGQGKEPDGRLLRKEAAPAEAPKAEQAPAEQAAAILNAAAEPPKGKERLDVLKDVKAGAITPDEVAAAYPPSAAQETTDAQRQQAADHAKDLGGRVVWQRGDLALIEGYSLLSGDSVYIAANGSQRTRVDIQSYTGKGYTEAQKAELMKARADAVRAADELLARNPDGPFADGPLVFADDIPAAVQGVVRGWIGLLGLDGARIVVTTPASGAAMADGMAGKFRRIGKASLSGDNTNGTMQPLGGDDFHIAVRPGVSTLKALEVMAHELGHIVERRAFAQASAGTQQAIRDAHAAWLKENGSGRALDMAQAMRAYRSGQTTGFSEDAKATEAGAYWRSFGEWFADQVSRWATTQDKPVGVVEQFFKRLADRLRVFFTGERAKFKPDATVAQWLDSLAKDVPPAEEVAAAYPAKEPAAPTNTEDAGAELTYNRRNRIKSGIKWDDIASKNDALKVKEAVKQNVYPRPDYQALVDGGMQPLVAHLVKQAYDAIAAKPNTRGAPTDADLQTYIAGVNRVMSGVLAWANDPASVSKWAAREARSAGAMLGKSVNLSELAPGGGKTMMEAVYPDGWKGNQAEVIVLGGNKLLGALQPSYDEAKRAGKAVDAGWPASQEAWEKRGIKVIHAEKIDVTYYEGKRSRTEQPYVSISYRVGQTRLMDQLIDGAESKDDPKVQAAVAAELEANQGMFIVMDKARRIVGKQETEEAAKDVARELTKREGKDGGPDDSGIDVAMARREGLPRRLDGENVSSDQLKEAFGFKGVNFGNWMKGDTPALRAERQAHLNHAYDSFADLADLFGVPAKAMSLNGMLGLAIGAQGNGKYAAHFVPGVNEINLTRSSGAGSLAHEWGHALDHYFAEQAGFAKRDEPFLTEHTTSVVRKVVVENGRERMVVDTDAQRIRPEIVERFKAIVQAMNKKPETVEQFNARQERSKEIAKSNVSSWLKSIRRDYVAKGVDEAAIDAIAARILALDVGDGKIMVSPTLAVHPVVDELRSLYRKKAGRVPPIDQIKGLQSNLDYYAYAMSEKPGAVDHVPQQVGTDYAAAAAALDKDKGGKRYWSTNLEKFARAFDAFVSDELESKAAKNTYLSHAGRTGETVPMGDERKTINAAIKALVGEIQTREDDAGNVAMFSRAPGARVELEATDAVGREFWRKIDNGEAFTDQEVLDALSINRRGSRRFARAMESVADKAGSGQAAIGWQGDLASFGAYTSRASWDGENFNVFFVPDSLAAGADLSDEAQARDRALVSASFKVLPDGRYELSLTDPQPGSTAVDALERAGVAERAGTEAKPYTRVDLSAGDVTSRSIMQEAVRRLALNIGQAPNVMYAARDTGARAGRPGTERNYPADTLRDKFSRAPAGRAATMTVPQVQGIVANIKAAWRNAPNVVVVESLSGPDVPERVREAEKAAAMNGAGVGRGVILGDTVYLAAGAMATDAMVAETLFHEALGHYGLRGMFGKDFDTILGQLAKTLPEKVTAKAIEYGLNPLEQADRLTAAEEVLAEIAQTRPTSTWVQRAIAAIRTWLRTNIPGFADMALNEAEVIRNFIMPARAFVERGRLAAMRDMPAFSRGPASTWYSALARQVSAASMNAGTASAWGAILKNWITTGKVKADEVEWSGLGDWLALQDGKVSKAQVADYLGANGVQITETVLSDGGTTDIPPGWELRRATEDDDVEGRWVLVDEDGEVRGSGDTSAEAMEDGWDADSRADNPTKYANYTLPGGTNYREVLLTLPGKADTTPDADGFSDARQEARDYRSSHWEQRNVLAHIRVNDRTDASGARVLFVEEVQSDWAQEGKKKGFDTSEAKAAKAALEQEADALREESIQIQMTPYAQQSVDQGRRLNAIQVRLREIRETAPIPTKIPEAPFVGTTDKWVALALKRVIKMAVDGGYDKVAFVTGEQSADRYDLSKQVSRVSWNPKTGELGTMGLDNLTMTDVATGVKAEQLSDYIGKDAADKLIAADENDRGFKVIAGDDLKVGGSGMRAFYDKIVPAVAKDMLKKMGGGALESVQIDQQREISTNVDDGAGGVIKRKVKTGVMLEQPGFTITQAMRDKAQGGMPAFSRAADQTQTSAFKRWFGDSKVVDAQGKPLRLYHGTGADITEFRVSDRGEFGGGIYLTPDASGASDYATYRGKGPANVLPVYVSIKNPAGVAEASQVASWKGEENARAELIRRGYDGVIDMRSGQVVAFYPEQIKSAIGNSGAFDPGTADIRFSRAPSASAAPEWITSGSAALQGAAGKIDTYAPTKTIAEKVSEMSAGWKQKLVQGMFDAYAPLKALSMDAYIAARMTKAADGAFEGMLMYGKPVMTADGGITGDLDGKGFLGAMRELNGEHDRFFMWLAGNRAERLMSEGKENLFTADEIAAMKALNGGTTPDGRPRTIAFKRALDEFNAYSKAVLDVAEKAGLIDGESRKLWEHDFYVPFYRMSQENEISGPTKIKGLVRQKAFERLKGGKDNLGDLMDNTLRNWSHLLSASLANVAASKSLLAAERAGIAIEAREAQAKEIAKAAGLKGNATYFMDQGLQRWFVVEDPAVLQAISAMEAPALNGLPLQIMAKFKKYLTVGVTIAPAFKVRNLIRDTLAAPAANEMSFNIAKNLSQGWKATDTKTSGYAQMLFSGGLMRFGTYLEGDRAEHVKRLIADGVDDKTILNTPQKVKAMLGKAWDAWQDFGDRMENVNRTALYQQLLDKGMTPREAAFQARDMMDFSLQGSWAAMRTLTAVVPFLNARAQGLYKLGRAAGENPKRMGYMVAAVSLASIALMLAYQDDDDWKAREDWDRDAWWWFKIGETAYRIPKPFEVGAMGTIAERSLELVISDEMTGARFAERMKQMVTGTFAINPVPQMFKPMLDLYANKDSFTGRQIETLGMERLSKPERYGPNTSALARALGSAGDYTGVSPVQVDHMIRAYFGWLGTMGAATVDAATSPFSEIEKPAKKMDDYFGGFVKELPAASSRYLEDFYEQAKATSEAMADLRRAREAGDTEKAAEIMEERGDKVAQYRVYQQAQQQLAGLNKRIRIVRSSTELDADTKRLRLDELTELRNRIARQVSDRTRAREAALQ